MKGRGKSLIKQIFSYKESRGTIIADSDEAIAAAKLAIRTHRKQLEKYTRQNPIFVYSLEPVQVGKGPEVVKRMAEASEATMNSLAPTPTMR